MTIITLWKKDFVQIVFVCTFVYYINQVELILFWCSIAILKKMKWRQFLFIYNICIWDLRNIEIKIQIKLWASDWFPSTCTRYMKKKYCGLCKVITPRVCLYPYQKICSLYCLYALGWNLGEQLMYGSYFKRKYLHFQHFLLLWT